MERADHGGRGRRRGISLLLLLAACADFEEVQISAIPLPDLRQCVSELQAARTGLSSESWSACLYFPELRCSLRTSLDELCTNGGCQLENWSEPSCTTMNDPEATLDREAELQATLRIVHGELCPGHEDVYEAGAPRDCAGSALSPSPECLARLDFTLATNDSGQLTLVDENDVDIRLSALFAEELERNERPLPCQAQPELAETAPVCARLDGDGLGTLTSQPFSDLGCSRTSSTSPSTICSGSDVVVGRKLSFTANPAACTQFSDWSGACVADGSSCTLTVAPEATCVDNEVRARFEVVPLTLSLRVEGAGTVEVRPSGRSCEATRPCELPVPCGTELALVARPAPGFELSSWGGRCPPSEATCALGAITTSTTVTVRFAQGERTLTVDPSGLCREQVLGPERLECGDARTAATDCERRVPELSPQSLILQSGRSAEVVDWGLNCSGLNCQETPNRLTFEMPARDVQIAPVVGYPVELNIEGQGRIEGLGPACDGPLTPCPPRQARCGESSVLRASGVSLGICDSRILDWTFDGQPACAAEPRVCPLPPPGDVRTLTARFGLPVEVIVAGRGAVTVEAGGPSTRCAPGECRGASAPAYPSGASVDIVTVAGAQPLCLGGCDTEDLDRGICTLANTRCRGVQAILGRRVDVDINGACRIEAPAPTPRSSGLRRCRDEAALDVSGPAGRTSRTYTASDVTLTATGLAPNVEVVSFERCIGGSCTSAPIPPPSAGRFSLSLPGADDVEARIRCEAVYDVEVDADDGGVVSDAAGAPIQACRSNTGVCAGRYPESETVVLTATADSGALFIGWEAVVGSLPCASSANPCRFRPLENVELRARFETETQLSITIDTTPSGTPGGDVRSTTTNGPAVAQEINCPTQACQVIRVASHDVNLTAAERTGFRFDGWSGPCVPRSAATCRVNPLNRNRSVTAEFIAQRDLNATFMEGSLTANGAVCVGGTCTGTYDEGSSVTIVANPTVPGPYRFAWTGPCAGVTIDRCTLTLTSDVNLQVSATRLTARLVVEPVGDPNARVDAPGSNIMGCGPSTGVCVDNFDILSTVRLEVSGSTLTATFPTNCTPVDAVRCDVTMPATSTTTETVRIVWP